MNPTKTIIAFACACAALVSFSPAQDQTIPELLGNGNPWNVDGEDYDYIARNSRTLGSVIGTRTVRMGAHLGSADGFYNRTTHELNFSGLDNQMLAAYREGLQPIIQINYYSNADWGYDTNILYYRWYDIGRAVADRYRPNSAWWTGQGINNFGVRTYSAINEPWNSWNNPAIPTTSFRDAMKNFADGVHAIDAGFPVVTGGMVMYDDANENKGYVAALKDLFNNRTLTGLNLHPYHGNYSWNVNDFASYASSAQSRYEYMLTKHGINWDVALCFTEWNFYTDFPGYDKAFFTYLWSTLGVVGRNGQGVTQFSYVWNLLQEQVEEGGSPAGWGMAIDRYPWDGEVRGDAFQMVCQLTQGMRFATRNPIRNWNGTKTGTGEYTLTGTGRKAWIWHNVQNWTTKYSTTYTVSDIPATARRLEIYRYNSWSQTNATQGTAAPYRTVTLSGQTSYTFNDLPQGETLFFLASDGVASGSTYKIVARHSGKVLDVSQNSAASGANVQQWSDNGSTAQRWVVSSTGDGYFKLIHLNTNQALDVQAYSTADGGNVHQWAEHGGPNQRWSLTAEPGGFWRLTNKNSSKVLDVSGGITSMNNGANVHQWSWANASNQLWRLEKQ